MKKIRKKQKKVVLMKFNYFKITSSKYLEIKCIMDEFNFKLKNK